MPDNHGGATPERYEAADAPAHPPQATAGPATVVAGMWYYLGPIALIVVVALMALFYWGDADDSPDDAVAPTTGISDEKTPGGGNPAPEPDSTKDESESRGGR
jgi:hypothetical protein